MESSRIVNFLPINQWNLTNHARWFGKPKKKHIPKPEQWHIKRALAWMQERLPKTCVEVEKVQFTGCRYFPRAAMKVLHSAEIRIKVLTHADTISDRALAHQIAVAELESQEQKRFNKNKNQDIAIFAVQLSEQTRTKEVRLIREAMVGAVKIVRNRSVLVMGLPNSGKSSLILPLTRARTLQVKKKRHYHLPKISSTAGRTLGMKRHVIEDYVGVVSLVDSPGLRPRLESFEDPRDLSLLLAARVIEPFHGYKTLLGDKQMVEYVLAALNRHASISREETPKYVKFLGLEGPTDDVDLFIEGVRIKLGKLKLDRHAIVRHAQAGMFGGLLFGFHPVLENVELPVFNRNGVVVYMNEAAQKLVLIGADKTIIPENVEIDVNGNPIFPEEPLDEDDDVDADEGEDEEDFTHQRKKRY